MEVSLANKGVNVVPHKDINSASIRSFANVTRVQVRSVNWTELANQVEENTLAINDHEGRIESLEATTEKLEERVSATEQTTEDLVYLVNTKMITFSELGEQNG